MHEDGRLQRLLGIPITRDPSPEVGAKPKRHDRTHVSDSRQPSQSPSRSPNKNGFQAILVDDSDSELSNEEYKLDSEDDFDDYDLTGILSDAEEGEIQEVGMDDTEERNLNGPSHKTHKRKQINSSLKSRHESVEEDPEMLPHEESIDPDLDLEESRYTVRPKPKSKPTKSRPALPMDESTDELSDSSIEILNPPLNNSKGRVGRNARKSYWASKAAPLEEDGFDGEADFVGLN